MDFANVKGFGATRNGKADDSATFNKAINSVDEGAKEIPTGRYVLVDQVQIDKHRIVLQGKGPLKTFLVIPKSLKQLEPK